MQPIQFRTAALFIIFIVFGATKLEAQDTTDLMKQLEKETLGSDKDKTVYTSATFKSTRVINGHSVENVGKGVLDFRISHRFGRLNEGGYELFGLDRASMRMGFEYGLTNNVMIGIGRTTFEKTFDAFIKTKILRQSTGKINMPVTLSYVGTIAIQTLKFDEPKKKNATARTYYTHQLIIGRKFSSKTSLQLMPTFTHDNYVLLTTDPHELFAIGIGGRQKITRRLSINAEYYYQLPGSKITGTTNSLSAGIDIETGGHVFQLHFTNSQGMSERSFITETNGDWAKGDVYFGFNISRVFNLGKNKKSSYK